VAAGKWAWQIRNCNDCHTILGIGAYYAPDVTKVMSYRNTDWTKRFLKDPEKAWLAKRKMPNPHLRDQEVADIVAFLSWVNEIDTNSWPPQPIAVSAAPVQMPGEAVYKTQGCLTCHVINGVGEQVGPDLTHVGKEREKKWIEAH